MSALDLEIQACRRRPPSVEHHRAAENDIAYALHSGDQAEIGQCWISRMGVAQVALAHLLAASGGDPILPEAHGDFALVPDHPQKDSGRWPRR